MPPVKIEIIKGKTTEYKEKLLEIIQEPPMENWGMAGKQKGI